ncbi:long-chain-fatty-acid CoA ligase [Chloropicon primus]|nr:long-chain-fatty-acid CoA ligase [Chloropicon primus]
MNRGRVQYRSRTSTTSKATPFCRTKARGASKLQPWSRLSRASAGRTRGRVDAWRERGRRDSLRGYASLVEETESDQVEFSSTFGAWRNSKSRETSWDLLPQQWARLAEEVPKDTIAVIDENNGKSEGTRVEWTYGELHEEICLFAWGLKSLGAEKGHTTCIFSENSARWLVADQGSSMLGCTNALRGITSPADELSFIVDNSQGRGLIVQNEDTLNHIWPTLVENGQHNQIGFVVVLWDGVTEARRTEGDVQVLSYADVINMGREASSAKPLESILNSTISEEDPYCIIYTSGTTGQPKGAMLSHKNIMYQIVNLHNVIAIPSETNVISLLPPWHVYQLATGYYSYSHGITNRYSNVANFAKDLGEHGCDFIVAVPLVIENLYKKVMSSVKKMPSSKRNLVGFFLKASQNYIQATRVVQGVSLKYVHERPSPLKMLAYWLVHILLKPIHALANKLVYSKIRDQIKISRTIVSGGGALSEHLEDFFEIVGVEIINGWGLTETSPVIAARPTKLTNSYQNARGTVGRPVPGTQIRAVDPETLEAIPDGQKGLLLAKGATIFGGYKQNPKATESAFRYGDGWFDTGDLGYIAPYKNHHDMGGMCVLVGREKETIVLSNGENVEPSPLEQACLASSYIEQIMVVGQDKKSLGALVVPDYEALMEEGIISSKSDKDEAMKFLKAEIKQKIEERDLFKPQESVRNIVLLEDPLTFEDGFLTRTMKERRHIVAEAFGSKIDSMFGSA